MNTAYLRYGWSNWNLEEVTDLARVMLESELPWHHACSFSWATWREGVFYEKVRSEKKKVRSGSRSQPNEIFNDKKDGKVGNRIE